MATIERTDLPWVLQSAENFADQYPDGEAFVIAAEVTQGYGGPEEGGWWYDVFGPLAVVPVNGLEDAVAMWHRLYDRFADDYRDERPRWSAAGGVDFTVYLSDEFPEPQPRPHYE